jgi:hypothetical protein
VTTDLRAPVPAENAWAGQGAVLLDIGGGVGALVVTMPPSTVGMEVEIRPVEGSAARRDHPRHEHAHLAHVAVVNRPVAHGNIPSLVFGELTAGSYELFAKGRPEAVALRVDVVGARVTSATWPS